MPKKTDNSKSADAPKPIILSRKPIIEDPGKRKGQNDLIPGAPAVDEKNTVKLQHPSATSKVIPKTGDVSTSEPAEKSPAPKATEEPEDPETNASPEPADEPETKSKGSKPMLASVKEIIEPEEDSEQELKPDSEPEEPVSAPTTGEKTIQPDIDMSKKPSKSETKSTSKSTDDEKTSDNDDEKPEEKPTTEDAKDSDDSKDSVDDKKAADTKSDDSSGDTESEEADDGPKATVQPTNGIVDELAKKAADKKGKDKEEKEAAIKNEQVSKLIEGKKYNLPIGQVTRRRNNRRTLIALVLLILLALVVANFAIDAGIIHTSIKPITNVIPN